MAVDKVDHRENQDNHYDGKIKFNYETKKLKLNINSTLHLLLSTLQLLNA